MCLLPPSFPQPTLCSLLCSSLFRKRKSEQGGKKSTDIVTFCQWWSWPLNSLKDGGWDEQLHTCARRCAGTETLYLMDLLASSLTLRDESHRPQPLPSSPAAVICSNFSLRKAMLFLPPGQFLDSPRDPANTE